MKTLYPNEEILNIRGRYGLYARGLVGSKQDSIERFQKAIAERMGVEYAFAMPSGRMALRMILRSLEMQPGAGVLVPAYSYFELPNIIEDEGFTPVFVDVDPVAGRMIARKVRESLGQDIRAVLVVHLFGVASEAEKIAASLEKDVTMIEDCAHTPLVSLRDDAFLGTIGDLSFLSFDRLKFINTMRGGMILTGDARRASALSELLRAFSIPTKSQQLKRILQYEAETLARHPVPYGLLGRWLARPALMEATRGLHRRVTDRQVLSERGFSHLQAELGLHHLESVGSYQGERLKMIKSYLDRLDAKAEGAENKNYVRELTKTFCQSRSSSYGFIVSVENPAEIQRAARGLGFEILKEDRIADFCPASHRPGSSLDDYPNARHLFRHAVKLPLPIGAGADRFMKFADGITTLIAKNLAPSC
ncbi:DegT/DnrJ/EryC1/StrS family aminotransferase [Thermodesulfobacteriota bacterium]